MKKSRSFADVLAEWQGGVRLKPGQSVSKKMAKSRIREIFGKEIVAYSSPGLTITIQDISTDECLVTVRKGKAVT